MEKFLVSAVQMNAFAGDLDHNLHVHQQISRAAAGAGCRLIMFPELSVTAHFGSEKVTELAEEASRGKIFEEMHAISRELGCVIGYGFCEKAHGAYYNSYALMGSTGLLGVQRKVHASQDEYLHFRMGRSFEIFDLGFCRVGILICFDANFFEAWRVLALKGAELVLLPHAGRSGWGEEVRPEEQLQILQNSLAKFPGRYGIYAEDNSIYAVFGNQIGFNGHSTHSGGACIIGPDGTLMAHSDLVTEDTWIKMELDPLVLQRERNSKYSLMRTRRPEVYGEITQMI